LRLLLIFQHDLSLSQYAVVSVFDGV
jgi:hypothetical protein